MRVLLAGSRSPLNHWEEHKLIRDIFRYSGLVLFGLALAVSASGQSSQEQSATTDQKRVEEQRHEPGPGREIGNGAGVIGTGLAKGTGNLAKGTAKGAADLVTLHPFQAGTSVGKGAAVAGKDVAVGTAKGTGKIARGLGQAFKKVF
jgi:hypothetical protein